MVEAFWDRRVIFLYARPSWIVVSVRDSDRYRTASAALSNDNPIGNSQFEKTTLAKSLQTPSCDRRYLLNCKQLGGVELSKVSPSSMWSLQYANHRCDDQA